MNRKMTFAGVLLAAALMVITWIPAGAAPQDTPAGQGVDEPTSALPPGPGCTGTGPHGFRGHGHRGYCADQPGFCGGPHAGERRMHARHDGSGHERAHLAAEGMLKRADELGLTDAQIEQLREIAYNTELKLIDMQSELRKARLEMKHESDIDQTDLSAIRKQLRSLADKRIEIHMARIENRIESMKILNDEQKKMIREKHPRMLRGQ